MIEACDVSEGTQLNGPTGLITAIFHICTKISKQESIPVGCVPIVP